MAAEAVVEKEEAVKGASKKKATKRGRKPRVAARVAKRATASRRRRLSTSAERERVLATAQRDGLTAKQVQKRFGVKPVTYYSWRKASRGSGRAASPGRRASISTLDLSEQIRGALRRQIAHMLPGLIELELSAVLGGARRRGRPRK